MISRDAREAGSRHWTVSVQSDFFSIVRLTRTAWDLLPILSANGIKHTPPHKRSYPDH